MAETEYFIALPEGDVELLGRIGHGAEAVVHLAIFRTVIDGSPVSVDAVAKVSGWAWSRSLLLGMGVSGHASLRVWYMQAPYALLPESRCDYGIEPGSEAEKFFVQGVVREANLQAKLRHANVTNM